MTIVHAFHIKSIFIFPRAAQVEKSLTNKFSTFEPQEKHEEKWSEIMSDSSNENSIGKIHMISTILYGPYIIIWSITLSSSI